MVEISLSGSEGAPGGQLPGATREAGINPKARIIAPVAAEGNSQRNRPLSDPAASYAPGLAGLILLSAWSEQSNPRDEGSRWMPCSVLRSLGGCVLPMESAGLPQ